MAEEEKSLVGCDPEFFVRNPNSGKFVPAWKMIEGTKHEPFKVDKGAVQVDGVALEINIDPVDNEDDFYLNIKTVMAQLKDMVPGYEVVIQPSATFDKEDWEALPDQAKEVGCDPDYNAYTRLQNPILDGVKGSTRYAAGHIHLGWTKGEDPNDPVHFADCCTMVRQLDYCLGLPTLMWDSDKARRQFYGKPGNFRPKAYGCEYRTPSNMWLQSEEHIRFVFRQTTLAYDMLMQGNDLFRDNQGHMEHWFDQRRRGYADQQWWNISQYMNRYIPYETYKQFIPELTKHKADMRPGTGFTYQYVQARG